MRRTAWCVGVQEFLFGGAVIKRRDRAASWFDGDMVGHGRDAIDAVAMLCDMCELSTANHRRFLYRKHINGRSSFLYIYAF